MDEGKMKTILMKIKAGENEQNPGSYGNVQMPSFKRW